MRCPSHIERRPDCMTCKVTELHDVVEILAEQVLQHETASSLRISVDNLKCRVESLGAAINIDRRKRDKLEERIAILERGAAEARGRLRRLERPSSQSVLEQNWRALLYQDAVEQAANRWVEGPSITKADVVALIRDLDPEVRGIWQSNLDPLALIVETHTVWTEPAVAQCTQRLPVGAAVSFMLDAPIDVQWTALWRGGV